jgi:hypothetical protein
MLDGLDEDDFKLSQEDGTPRKDQTRATEIGATSNRPAAMPRPSATSQISQPSQLSASLSSMPFRSVLSPHWLLTDSSQALCHHWIFFGSGISSSLSSSLIILQPMSTTLHLYDATRVEHRLCNVQGEWTQSRMSVGDTINIIGT